MRQSKTTNSIDHLRKHHVSQHVINTNIILTHTKLKHFIHIVLLTGFKPVTSGLLGRRSIAELKKRGGKRL